MKATYVWRDGKFVNKKTGKVDPPKYPGKICMPYVCSDIAEYASPIDGRMITSRSERREDLIRNDWHEVDPPKNRFLKNERFAKKHKVEHLLG